MALKASPNDQALLLELQAFDTRLAQLDHRAKSLPELATLAGFEKDTAVVRQRFAEQKGGLEDIEIELKRIESDVEVVEARIKRDESRVQSSSSVKDVAALEQELTALRKRFRDLEEIELAVMERMESQQKEVEKTTAQLDALALRTGEIEAEKSASLSTVTAERTVAASGRDAIAAKVPADLLALYEKQRARYGTGASMLRGGVSLASGVKLLENEMQAIRAAAPDDIIMCASSEAILVRTAESGL
ncbi:putative nucleic acid-binding Zn-ribbon protein [Salinibacterium sp. CAN_S4]|uniref:zinc ribbon domain-containing protein n=1 Tax=Salinibacterium sp. CAN_S4 TaxID=2787727 RepID=UPI001A294F6F